MLCPLYRTWPDDVVTSLFPHMTYDVMMYISVRFGDVICEAGRCYVPYTGIGWMMLLRHCFLT